MRHCSSSTQFPGCLAAVFLMGCVETATREASDPSAGGALPTMEDRIVQVIDVDKVWSGHPVDFALYTTDEWQFVAYYDGERRMTVAGRRLDQDTWQKITLPSTLGWDSHNHVVLAVDELGFLHVSGNMHNAPLVYFRSTQPLDVASLERVERMVGTNESSVTYPEFSVGPGGGLVFSYRDGGSGSGNHIFNRYDTASRSWSRLLDSPLTDGEGRYNAYPVGPVRDKRGVWHLVWVWRDTPDAETNHDLCYARSRNLVDWQAADGRALELPITLSTSDIVDPVPPGGGMINNNTHVGFDANGRPVVAYHKFDEGGKTQLYNARFEAGQWVSHRTSNWDYRWEFGGGGTLVFEIEVSGVEVRDDGFLLQRFFHAREGGDGAFLLDPATLRAIEQIEPPLPYPAKLAVPRSTTPEMVTRWQENQGRPQSDGRHFLRWETLRSNRDMPRSEVPLPTQLSLYVFAHERRIGAESQRNAKR